jgi:hypothetical protein
MEKKLKSGKEILDEFFAEIPSVENTDAQITAMLVELHNSDKISEKNIINGLVEIRTKP